MNPHHTPGSLFLTPRAPNGKRLPARARHRHHMRASEDKKPEEVAKEMQGLEGQMASNQFTVSQMPPEKRFWDSHGVPPNVSHETTQRLDDERRDKSIELPLPPNMPKRAPQPAPPPAKLQPTPYSPSTSQPTPTPNSTFQPAPPSSSTPKPAPPSTTGLGRLLPGPNAEDLERYKRQGVPEQPQGNPFMLPFDPSKLPFQPYYFHDHQGREGGLQKTYRW